MKLLTSFQMGELTLPNRLVMAPLTRNRATHGVDAPNDLTVEYYRQRASAGLIVSEASQISQEAQGYVWTPGLYTDAQVEGWRKVTQGVHAAGGRIFVQMWHVGRVSHTSLQPNGGAPVAPSALRAEGRTFTEAGFVEPSMPRALETAEIKRVVADYARAAANAKAAGFDGIELHGANGYLIDQFLKANANTRADSYGGSVENRCRFALEVVEAVCKVWAPKRVGIRLSPVSPANGVSDPDPQPVFNHLVRGLDAAGLGYIHVVEGSTGYKRDFGTFDYGALRSAFRGAYIANNCYKRDSAEDAVASGRADLVAFGRSFIANPDLVERFRRNAPLNDADVQTFYGGGAKGYTDYPTLAAG